MTKNTCRGSLKVSTTAKGGSYVGNPIVSVVRLPKNKQKVEALSRKLVEYQNRNPYKSPEQDPDTFLKKHILEQLINTGSVTFSWCRKTFGNVFHEDVFLYYCENALGVIHSYCHDDFNKITGGTGIH